ncbi:MAG: hypothetical protein K0R44_3770 [Thermomicrobiales bacterium]|nr:hypothetical protein [Thermomicrobiales bacterium]
MARELSELLGELSNQARKVEDTFAEVAEETDAKAAERRDQTRAAAKAAVDTMDASITAVEESVEGNWRALTSPRCGARRGAGRGGRSTGRASDRVREGRDRDRRVGCDGCGGRPPRGRGTQARVTARPAAAEWNGAWARMDLS